jgi:hypothetical protein
MEKYWTDKMNSGLHFTPSWLDNQISNGISATFVLYKLWQLFEIAETRKREVSSVEFLFIL